MTGKVKHEKSLSLSPSLSHSLAQGARQVKLVVGGGGDGGGNASDWNRGGGRGGEGHEERRTRFSTPPSHDAAEASAAALGPLPIFAVRSTGP